MTDVVTVDPENQTVPPVNPMAASAPSTRRDQDPVLRRRMRRQAQVMLLMAFLMLVVAFSVPFVLHYLDITIP